MINQTVARGFLTKLKMNVYIANNGLEAFEMPVMDGFEATKNIRLFEVSLGETPLESGRHLPCPIIALSASVMPEYIDYCMESGVNDYMSKPVVRAIFEEKLVEWMPV